MELFLRNPKDGVLPNSFYRKLTKRGAYHNYYKPNKSKLTKQRVKKNLETVVENEFEFFNAFSCFNENPEQICMKTDILRKMKLIQLKNGCQYKNGLPKKQHELMFKILNGEDVEPKDHTHFDELKKKLAEIFK